MPVEKEDIDKLREDIIAHRESSGLLRERVHEIYPRMSVVEVDNPSYKGQGVMMFQDHMSHDHLNVMLSNGNVWSYETETIVRRVIDKSEWAPWIVEWMKKR